MERWIFGKRPHASVLLRWLDVPLLRASLLVIGISIVLAGHSTWVSGVGAMSLGVWALAALLNFMLVRRGGRTV